MIPLLEVRDLVAGYGDSDILRGLSLHVDRGELVAVIGPNGAGKSTLLKALAGLVRPRAGRIALHGSDITGAGTHRIVTSGVCSGASAGRRRTDTRSDAPGGATHPRPRRPRPAVWKSATATRPAGAPRRASSSR